MGYQYCSNDLIIGPIDIYFVVKHYSVRIDGKGSIFDKSQGKQAHTNLIFVHVLIN